jgi:hypothetical protein
VLLTTVVLVGALTGIGATFGARAATSALMAWPGILLLSHAGWAVHRGAIRARLNRKENLGDPDDFHWVITVWNADTLTRRESPAWF